MSHTRNGLTLACLLSLPILAACGNTAEPLCPTGAAVETDGHRRLALIVGIGDYKAVSDLHGPANDARRVYQRLTAEDGYGFPKENVCMLLDGQATTAAVRQAFDDVLVARARDDDIAVFFYAGHGSQTRDRNGDEPDNKDETLVLHDARTEVKGQRIRDLVDDEFNGMLARLHARTHRIVVMLDSCNSGTVTRDAGAIARFVEPDEAAADPAPFDTRESPDGDGAGGWAPEALPGLVVMTAASDGTSALEVNGHGIFTDAVIQVLARGRDNPLTYAQLAREVPPIVKASSYQVTYFQGELNQPVFGSGEATRPLGWDVVAAGPPVELVGPPLPGFGQGAELYVYDAATTGSDTRDPRKAKAVVVVTGGAARSAAPATATIVSSPPQAQPIATGDLAVLARAAVPALKVRIRPAGEPGGIPAARSRSLRDAIAATVQSAGLVELTDSGDGFELSVLDDGHLVLWGPENRVRNRLETDGRLPHLLTLHAKQRALLQLAGDVGADFSDNETLQVKLVPVGSESQCARGPWQQADPNDEQIVPLCHAWRIQVTLGHDSPVPLIVGGAILSSSGAILGLPTDGRTELLRAGESVVFSEIFRGLPPIETQDYIMIVGVQEGNQIPWHMLTTAPRDAIPANTLHRTIQRYINRRNIGGLDAAYTSDAMTWTRTLLPVRVAAHTRFVVPRSLSGPVSTREYTVKVDIRPYLPGNEESALNKVLSMADWLVNSPGADGFGYGQHDWSKPTDEENLRVGIDCSRAVWFAFTRAGLKYNKRGDMYLPTVSMVSDNTAMQDYFDACPTDGEFEIGDLLVYRSAERGDGHVVMVIDAASRIAWGSHGWDGTPRLSAIPGEPDTGVEYQKIKVKKDWRRWDRQDMNLARCWRYRDFATQTATTAPPGIDNLIGNPCEGC